MNMRRTLLFFICWLMAVPAFAEFYQYTDAHGNLRFTDNIGDVPADQLPKIKRYHELAPEAAPAVPAAIAAGEEEKGGQVEKPKKNIQQTAEVLDKEKKELDLEFAALQKEKEDLLKPLAKDAPPEAVKAHEKKKEELNGRIKVYEQKRTAFKKKIDDFEARVKSSRKNHANSRPGD